MKADLIASQLKS